MSYLDLYFLYPNEIREYFKYNEKYGEGWNVWNASLC